MVLAKRHGRRRGGERREGAVRERSGSGRQQRRCGYSWREAFEVAEHLLDLLSGGAVSGKLSGVASVTGCHCSTT